MNQQEWMMRLPGIQPDEIMVIQAVIKDMTDQQQQQFFTIYSGRRKEEQTILLLTLIGFFGFAGIQRFLLNEVGMGILYFVTAGFCGIGTIIDLVNHKKMTSDYNYKQAVEVANMMKMMNQ